MGYCTVQDLIERFGERELRDSVQLDADAPIEGPAFAAAIVDASAEIDAYLSQRYAVPIQRRVPVLVTLACQIARYRLLDGRDHKQAIERYERAIELLKALASGEVGLGDAAAQGESSTVGGAEVRAERHPFDRAARRAFLGRLS